MKLNKNLKASILLTDELDNVEFIETNFVVFLMFSMKKLEKNIRNVEKLKFTVNI
jgi:hypothetical protein